MITIICWILFQKLITNKNELWLLVLFALKTQFIQYQKRYLSKNGEQLCLSCSNKLDSNVLNEISNMDKEEVLNLIKRNDECCLCHEKLTMFNTGIANRLKNGERVCVNCIRKLDAETVCKLKNLTFENLIERVDIQEKAN